MEKRHLYHDRYNTGPWIILFVIPISFLLPKIESSSVASTDYARNYYLHQPQHQSYQSYLPNNTSTGFESRDSGSSYGAPGGGLGGTGSSYAAPPGGYAVPITMAVQTHGMGMGWGGSGGGDDDGGLDFPTELIGLLGLKGLKGLKGLAGLLGLLKGLLLLKKLLLIPLLLLLFPLFLPLLLLKLLLLLFIPVPLLVINGAPVGRELSSLEGIDLNTYFEEKFRSILPSLSRDVSNIVAKIKNGGAEMTLKELFSFPGEETKKMPSESKGEKSKLTVLNLKKGWKQKPEANKLKVHSVSDILKSS